MNHETLREQRARVRCLAAIASRLVAADVSQGRTMADPDYYVGIAQTLYRAVEAREAPPR